jgi:hypothetical protein
MTFGSMDLIRLADDLWLWSTQDRDCRIGPHRMHAPQHRAAISGDGGYPTGRPMRRKVAEGIYIYTYIHNPYQIPIKSTTAATICIRL